MLPTKPSPKVYFKLVDSFSEELGIGICSAHPPSSIELPIIISLIYLVHKV